METKVERKKGKLPVFEKRFNKLRGELSQAEFAEKLGVSRPVIGFYENGERVPDILTLKKIAETYNVSADWLLGLSDIKSGNADDMAIEKRLGLSEEAIKTLERLMSSEKKLRDEYNSNDSLGSEWEDVHTSLEVKERFERGNNIIKMLNTLLSTQRRANTLYYQTHAEFIFYMLYDYFYLKHTANDLERFYCIACIYKDIIEFGQTLKVD